MSLKGRLDSNTKWAWSDMLRIDRQYERFRIPELGVAGGRVIEFLLEETAASEPGDDQRKDEPETG